MKHWQFTTRPLFFHVASMVDIKTRSINESLHLLQVTFFLLLAGFCGPVEQIFIPKVCIRDAWEPVLRQVNYNGLSLCDCVGFPVFLQAFFGIEIEAMHEEVDFIVLEQFWEGINHVLAEEVCNEDMINLITDIFIDPLTVTVKKFAEHSCIVFEFVAD